MRVTNANSAYRNPATTDHCNVIAIVQILCGDGVRQIRQYMTDELHMDAKHIRTRDSDTVINMNLYRAERNLYVSGFALFFWLVIRRMVQMLHREAQLLVCAAEAIEEAASDNEQPDGTRRAKDHHIKKLENRISRQESEENEAVREHEIAIKRDKLKPGDNPPKHFLRSRDG